MSNRLLLIRLGWVCLALGVFLFLIPSSFAGTPPAGKVKQLKAQIKSSSKVADYIRYSFKLGQLYRDHKAYPMAIDLYKALGNKYNKPDVLCGVYHYWAQSLLKLKKVSAGLAVYQKLKQKFRGCQCEFLPNAFIAMGRVTFDKKDYAKALSLYRKVPRCRENRIAAIAAEYMKGWCTYKLGRYKKALRAMTRTLKEVRKNLRRYRGRQKAKLQKVQTEAFPNFVRAYSRAGDVKRALRTFRQLAPKAKADKMLEQLASSYRTTKNYKHLIVLYTQLSRANRGSPRQVYYWLEILRASHRINNTRSLLRSLQTLEKVTKENLANAAGNSKLNKDIAATQKQIHQFAKYKHTEAQKTNNNGLYRQAEPFFATYRRLFPQAKDANTMSFWHGEVLLELKKYKQAAQAYSVSARHPKVSKYTLDATYKSALAHHRLLKNAQSLTYKKPSSQKQAKAKTIPEKYQLFLTAGSFYRTKYPKDKNVPYVTYNMGLVYQKYNHWDKARKEFMVVIKNHTTTKYARPAAYHVVDTLRIRQEWEILYQTTKTFAEMPLLGRRLFKRQMKTMSRAARLKICFVLDIGKQRIKAAECYLKIAKDLGNHKDTPTVLYNAHVAYHNARDMKKAEAVKQQILRQFPRSQAAKRLK